MAAVRGAVGSDVGVGLDFHGRVKVPACKRMMQAADAEEVNLDEFLAWQQGLNASKPVKLTRLASKRASMLDHEEPGWPEE